MSEPQAPAATADVVEPGVEIVPGDPPAGKMEAIIPSRNYQQAVELGHVLAASGLFLDARDPAKAAVKVMVGMDLGISPTAALRAIHTFEDDGKIVFLIEGKVLGALIKARPGYDYRFVERDDTRCTITFLRNDEALHPDVTYTMEDAQRAGLTGKRNWQRHPREMLTWRCMAEGQRIHFPELTAGQPIYASEEFSSDEGELRDGLKPDRPPPLTDEKAEALREAAKAAYDELKEINPERVPPGRFNGMVQQAEHSHARLQGVVDSMIDLRDTEGEIRDLSSQIAQLVPKEAHKALMERAERRGSNRERIDLLNEALAEAGGDTTPEKEGETDGSSDTGTDDGADTDAPDPA